MPAQYPNNLENIMSSSDPVSMRYAMQQQGNALAQDRLDQQRQTLANQYSEQENPIKIKQAQANLEQTQATTPGIAAQSGLSQLKLENAKVTQDSDQQSAIHENLKKVSDSDLQRFQAMGQHMVQMADYVDQGGTVPIEAQGQLPKDVVDQLSTSQGRQKLRQRGMQMAADTAEHIQARQLEGMRNNTTIRAAQIAADSRLQSMQLRLQMQHQASNLMEKALLSGNPEQVAAAYDMKAQIAAQDGDNEAMQYAVQKSKEYRQRANSVAINKRPAALDMPAAANQGVIQNTPVPAAQAPIVPGVKARKEADGSITLE